MCRASIRFTPKRARVITRDVNITNKPLEIDIEIPHLSESSNVRINEYVLDKKKTVAKETRLPVAMKLRLEPSAFVMLEIHGL